MTAGEASLLCSSVFFPRYGIHTGFELFSALLMVFVTAVLRSWLINGRNWDSRRATPVSLCAGMAVMAACTAINILI